MVEVRVVIVQHGEKASGPGDPGLTERGRLQARAAGEFLRSIGATEVKTIPMHRALETAQVVSDVLGVPLSVDPRLRERMNWQGTELQALNDFLADWERTSRDRDAQPRIGDSSRATGDRMLQAVRVAAERSTHGPVVCVSHGGATVDLLRTLVGDVALDEISPGIITDGVPSGAVTSLSVGLSQIELDRVAEVDHLPVSIRSCHRRS